MLPWDQVLNFSDDKNHLRHMESLSWDSQSVSLRKGLGSLYFEHAPPDESHHQGGLRNPAKGTLNCCCNSLMQNREITFWRQVKYFEGQKISLYLQNVLGLQKKGSGPVILFVMFIDIDICIHTYVYLFIYLNVFFHLILILVYITKPYSR